MPTREGTGYECVVPGCEDEATASGMCDACYSWDYYHRRRKHGMAYFLKYEAKNKRLLSRAKLRMGRGGLKAVRNAS